MFSPGGAGRKDNEGFDAFIPLIDSGVSLYLWTPSRFAALVMFTCKAFNTNKAVDFTRTFFAMNDSEYQQF